MKIASLTRSFYVVGALAISGLLGCRSPVLTNTTTKMSVNISIPGTITSDVPAAVRAALAPEAGFPGASARYIHPDTQYIIGLLTFENTPGNTKTISSSGTRAEGQSSVELVFEAVPVNKSAVIAVRLYDGEGAGAALLGTGTLTVASTGGDAALPVINVTPIAGSNVVLGPYAEGSRGARISESSNGKVFAYSFTVEAAGPYTASLAGNGLSAAPAVFTASGERVSAARSSTNQNILRFNGQPGNYYVVAEIPASYADAANLAVDADVIAALHTPSIYVDDSLSVMDRKRPIALSCPAGFAEGSYSAAVSDDSAELVGYGLADGTYSISTPRTAKAAAKPSLTFSYSDRLLGIARTGTLELPAQRTVVYVCPVAESPAWTGDRRNNLYDSANYINASYSGDAGTPVLALRDGKTISEANSVNFNDDVLVVGGCGDDWGRASTHGSSAVSLVAYGSSYTLGVTSGGAGTAFYDLRLQQTSQTMTSSVESLIALAGSASFQDCVIQSGAVIGYPGSSPTYSIIGISSFATAGTYSFKRCEIRGTSYTPASGTYASGTLYGISGGTSTAAITTIVSNSLVDPGIFACVGDGMPYIYGVQADSSSRTLIVVGSTVSTGTIESYSNQYGTAAALSATGSAVAHAYNNLLIDAAAYSDGNGIYMTSAALAYSAGSAGFIRHNALSNRCAAYEGYVLNTPGYVYRDGSYIASTIGATNSYSLLAGLGMTGWSSGDYTPTAASFLTTGGVDLRSGAARAALDSVIGSLSDDYFALDLRRKPRSASAIGAYEK